MTDKVVSEVSRECLVTRTRKLSRVVTGIYDEELRPFGIGSPQFSLLVVIARLQSANRAEIGRANLQDRSTLTRNLRLMLSQGWIEEVPSGEGRKGRSIVITKGGKKLLHGAIPGWRKAQSRAKAVFGREGVAAVTTISDGI
jgi:DNA-binding MarR family transcriptional regulator